MRYDWTDFKEAVHAMWPGDVLTWDVPNIRAGMQTARTIAKGAGRIISIRCTPSSTVNYIALPGRLIITRIV